ISRKSTTIDVAKAANQKLQVNHRTDHAQKASPVHYRRTDQNHSASRFSATNCECLAVIGAAFTSSGICTLQLTLQKSIRRNAPSGDSLGFGIEQGGIGKIARR